MRCSYLLLLMVFCATLGLAQQAAPAAEAAPQRMKSFDLDALDRGVEPCQDFYRFACGGWLKANPIPADKTRWGRFGELRDYNVAVTKQILEKAAANTDSTDPNQRKIGDYYATCMDEKGTDAKGLAPVEKWLHKIDGIQDAKGLTEVVAELHARGIGGMFTFRPNAELHNAAKTGAWADQGGLGLFNKDFYTKTDEKSVKTRQQYVEHIGNMLKLMGVPEDQAAKQAQQVMAIEMKLAEASMDPTSRRNTTKLDHWMKRAEFEALAPSFGWDKYFVSIGSPAFTELNVAVPEFYTNLEGMLKSVPLEQWKTYLKWHLIHGQAEALPTQFGDENFNFYGKILGGAEKQEPLWKRCARSVDEDLGEALGQYYVKEAFGGNAKERTLKMVHDIENAMETDIKSLDWMSDETKQKALEKLHAIANKIGYPDHWRDYSTLQIKRGDRLGNSLRSNLFERHRQLDKIGGPVDKTEWGMTPPTVNAYYSSLQNNINFPAGILQPPFFDNGVDDAVNYGAIGVVIGHELTHGFDDSGARFAANGDLQNWWTDQDKAEFEKRTACVADQYSGYSPVEGVSLNGKLTLGENTADNGGARIAMMALRDSMKSAAAGATPGHALSKQDIADLMNGGVGDVRVVSLVDQHGISFEPDAAYLETLKAAGASQDVTKAIYAASLKSKPGEIDGFTPEQRFWIGFAQVWCENVRPETSRNMALRDPHSPGQFRANGVASNSSDFQQAFHCKVGDPMVRKDACRVW